MKKKLEFDFKNNYCFLLAPALTLIVILTAFAIGGVFPFGTATVDYYDMSQGIVPSCYHIWDALHRSDVSLWFNWLSGLGVSNVNTGLSLFWAVLLVIPRAAVEKSMSVYVCLLFAAASMSACLFLRRAVGAKPFWCTVLSLCYAFCGYSVMYYTNMWQDTVFLFPLLMLVWIHMMKKGKIMPYVVLLIINLMCGYYVFTLAMFYMFFMSWIYLKINVDKSVRKRRALQLGLGTFMGYGLSCVFFVPKIVLTLSSERFLEKTGFDFSNIINQYMDIAKTVKCMSYDKWAMLFSCSLPIGVVLYGVIKNRKAKRKNVFFISNIALTAVLIVCEGANALMHFGDYKYFPMRMGYALTFALIWAAAYYSKQVKPYKISLNTKSPKEVTALAVNVVSFVLVFGAVYFSLHKFDDVFKFEYAVIYAVPILVCGYIFLLNKKNRLFDYRISAAALLAEIMVITMLFVPYWNTEMNEQEHSSKYISQTQKLAEDLNIERSNTSRIKTIGTTLNCNYGTVMGRAAIADWTHLIPAEIQSSLKAYGYSAEYTRLHDSGGTAFTDAVLGVDNVLSVKDESTALYTKTGSAGGYNYYDCNYTIPYGIICSGNIEKLELNGDNWIENNNKLYSALNGTDSQIIKKASLDLKSKQDDTQTYIFHSEKDTTAYFDLNGAKRVKVYVNGREQLFPSVDREDYAKYPGRFNRNVVSLGEFGDTDVEIKLVFTDGKYQDSKDFRKNDDGEKAEKNQKFSVSVGLLDLNKLKSFCALQNGKGSTGVQEVDTKNYQLSAKTYTDNNDSILLLPLQYNGAWSATVNGKNTEVMKISGALCGVKLSSGENSVCMTFVPPGLKTGAVISAVFAVFAVIVFLFKRKNAAPPALLCTAVSAAYDIAFYIAALSVYIIPLLYLAYWLLRRLI